ncbi:MAG: chitobiase/beta-hexosaminidase C-terminal domain-containing protein [Lachnospiraceae bacterium]|nr:chitobiase/beta-hexosaminidase C-terminal domain-containing protein [Lachnospiraceae bacterium]
MKCPKCGKEIAEDALFCEFCFADIRIVPEYEAELQQKLNETMHEIRTTLEEEEGLAKPDPSLAGAFQEESPVPAADIPSEDEILLNAKRHDAETDRLMRKLFFMGIGFIIALIVGISMFVVYRLRQLNTDSYYVGRAYSEASEGRYDAAAEDITRALGLMDAPDPELILLRAEYQQRAGKTEEALASALSLASDTSLDQEYRIDAYGRIISIYSGLGDYSKINETLAACGDPAILTSFQEYLIYDPVFEPEQGYYSGELTVTIDCAGNGTIFYTMDGSDPTTESMLYTKPLVLKEGRYRISAVYVNHFGMKSTTVTKVYTIE